MASTEQSLREEIDELKDINIKYYEENIELKKQVSDQGSLIESIQEKLA